MLNSSTRLQVPDRARSGARTAPKPPAPAVPAIPPGRGAGRRRDPAPWDHEPVENAAELNGLMSSLAREEGVFGRVAHHRSGSLAEQVRTLAVQAEQAWEHCAVPGSRGPDTPDEVADALGAISTERAQHLLTYLSAEDLVFPGHRRRDRAGAHRAARRMVKLLGHRSFWCTNIEDLTAGLRAWTPVTRHTFDGVVAGTGNGVTVVLLQVGED